MRPVLLAACALSLLLLSGCQPRMPLNRTEVSAAARNWCVRDGRDWGDPVEVAKPPAGEADAAGRRWWRVRFAPAPDGAARLALVDADSGWVQQAP